ncbi:serine/threonine-protein kinase protein ACR4 [Trifolium repens]|nr:serine/threonine-protein kinase protein ACR4 [Trifolium repens]
MEEFKVRKAQRFTYEELETATNGFKEESIVGKGSFSCVFRGVLKDGTVVAVKRAKELNWIRRVTIAVQAARGIEYLYGYACPIDSNSPLAELPAGILGLSFDCWRCSEFTSVIYGFIGLCYGNNNI